ncbi:8823_t:CDS:2 [Gigaspora margarita]|uniref:8823_t:CDS:1 n=1 Tax=Gigaspora margarita TaxID=4874 RepID=A0ABN7UV90_GIGMA|nr:8823_t:CDS:2 [Gigaspora margarita]
MAQRCEYREWLDNAIRKNQFIKHDYNTFNDIIPVGHGSFGKVSSASSKFKSKVALKSIRINPDFTIELLVNELKQHICIGSHNNILEFYGIIEKELNEFVLILEYANNGTLKDYLYNNFCVLNWDDKLCLAKQLTDAIKFLHSHDIIHRDLHSENVLIHDKIVKLSDFGNSKFIADPSIQLTKELGSIRYSDPEFLRSFPNYSRTKKSDIYSLGVLFWEISSGREPFKFEPLLRLLSRIISGLKEKPIHGTPKDYVNIYEECWKSIPDQRPTIEEIVFNIENVNLDNVISIEEIEVDDYVDNRQPDITSIIQGLVDGIDADSEHFHELYEALSLASNSASNSTSNINKALNLSSNIDDISSINDDLNLLSNINEALNLSSNINETSNSTSNFNEEPILKIDSKTFEYIDNLIKDSDKQFLQQLVQLFFNHVNISEEPKLLVDKIQVLIKESNKNSDKIFKKLLKHQGQPIFAYLIGFFYDHGIGIKVNKQKAQKMYEQAQKYNNNIQRPFLLGLAMNYDGL